MNNKLKQHYEDVITAIINDDSTAAQKSFHEVLRLKTRAVLGEMEHETDDVDVDLDVDLDDENDDDVDPDLDDENDDDVDPDLDDEMEVRESKGSKLKRKK